MAADRTPFICQGQSINLYLSADVDKWDLMMPLEILGVRNKKSLLLQIKIDSKGEL